MKSHKFFVQDRYGTTYRIYCGYEAPVLGPTKPQNLSAEHDAHEFIIRLRLDHAFCLKILRVVDGLTANSDISLAYSQRDLARVSWGWQRRIRFYRLDPFAYDFDNTSNNHYPVIRPAHDTASRGMAYHFVPATVLLLSDPNPEDVKFFGIDEWPQASEFLDTLALTDEQLAMMTEELKLRAGPNRADRFKSLLAGLTKGKIVIVRIYDDITPPKREGPEDLPVEEYTPKPYTLGPHEELGYVLSASSTTGHQPLNAKSETEKSKENRQEQKQNKEEEEHSANNTLFKTQHGAAEYVSRKINQKSISENREYGGMIYQNEDGTYSYTGPIKGSIDGVDPGGPSSVPKGKKPVAYYHTHGGDDPVYDNENFSNIYDPVDKEWYGDIPYADSNKIDGYLATPKGKFKYYSHKNNQVKLISEL